MDSVHTALKRLDAYIHQNELNGETTTSRRPMESCTIRARSVANFILQGVCPLSFRERVKTRLKWSERVEGDPEQVRRMMLEIAVVLEEEEANRALDEEMDRRGG